MWILPSNHQLYSHFAPECLHSKEDLSEQSEALEQSLMWRSKPLLLKIWSNKWSKVFWLPHLFSRTLKDSSALRESFEEKWISSLPDTHASRLAWQEAETEKKTQDTYGHSFIKSSMQLDLFAVSSKTSPVILHSDTSRSDRIYSKLVIRLKKEYSVRKKSARHTKEKDCSLLHWTTPTSSDGTMSKKDLSKLVLTKNGTYRYLATNGKQSNAGLSNQVQKWPTPAARDYKGANSKDHFQNKERPHMDQLPNAVIYGQHDQDNTNLNGKNLVLNPAWVLQLMGTTIAKTFFAWREMPSLNRRQNLHSEH